MASKAELEKVPLVKGLMSYREDNEKLYLTNGRTWQALVKQKQVTELIYLRILSCMNIVK